MKHIVLLGDSSVDNKFYVERGNPSIIEQLQLKSTERGWKASSVAQDGHSISHISQQLKRIPSDSTHLVVSVGGNDVLDSMNLLKERTTTIGQSLLRLSEATKEFEQKYIQMLNQLEEMPQEIILCTIYRPNFDDKDQQQMCQTGLILFNDSIIRQSIQRGFPLIDLTGIFNDKFDYANHIEPDVQGGKKMVENILYLLDHHRFHLPISSIFAKTNL